MTLTIYDSQGNEYTEQDIKRVLESPQRVCIGKVYNTRPEAIAAYRKCLEDNIHQIELHFPLKLKIQTKRLVFRFLWANSMEDAFKYSGTSYHVLEFYGTYSEDVQQYLQSRIRG